MYVRVYTYMYIYIHTYIHLYLYIYGVYIRTEVRKKVNACVTRGSTFGFLPSPGGFRLFFCFHDLKPFFNTGSR